jgi:hypothetical protein
MCRPLPFFQPFEIVTGFGNGFRPEMQKAPDPAQAALATRSEAFGSETRGLGLSPSRAPFRLVVKRASDFANIE